MFYGHPCYLLFWLFPFLVQQLLVNRVGIACLIFSIVFGGKLYPRVITCIAYSTFFHLHGLPIVYESTLFRFCRQIPQVFSPASLQAVACECMEFACKCARKRTACWLPSACSRMTLKTQLAWAFAQLYDGHLDATRMGLRNCMTALGMQLAWACVQACMQLQYKTM